MAEQDTDVHEVVENLRRNVHPTRIVAVLMGGRKQEIDLGDKRGRWQRIERVLETIDWEHLECYGGEDGKTQLDVVGNDASKAGPTATRSAVAEQFETCGAFVDRMVDHLRKHDVEIEQSKLVFIQLLVERVAELQGLMGDALTALRDAAVTINGGGENDADMTPKDKAVLAAIDGIGQKFLGLPPLQFPGGKIYALPAAGATGTEGKEV